MSRLDPATKTLPVKVGQVRAAGGGSIIVVVKEHYGPSGRRTGRWVVLPHDFSWHDELWTVKDLQHFAVLGDVRDDELIAQWGFQAREKRRVFESQHGGPPLFTRIDPKATT